MTQTGIKEEHEDPPGHRPPYLWEDFPWERRNDWRWRLDHCLNTAEDFRAIRLTSEEEATSAAFRRFRVDVPPHLATPTDLYEPTCPIRRQVIPTVRELPSSEAEIADSPVGCVYCPVPGPAHRYPDRVLLLATPQFVRCCTRSHVVGGPRAQLNSGAVKTTWVSSPLRRFTGYSDLEPPLLARKLPISTSLWNLRRGYPIHFSQAQFCSAGYQQQLDYMMEVIQ